MTVTVAVCSAHVYTVITLTRNVLCQFYLRLEKEIVVVAADVVITAIRFYFPPQSGGWRDLGKDLRTLSLTSFSAPRKL